MRKIDVLVHMQYLTYTVPAGQLLVSAGSHCIINETTGVTIQNFKLASYSSVELKLAWTYHKNIYYCELQSL